MSRTWRVAADLITVRLLLKYVTRPLHFFGPVGFVSVAAGVLGGGWVALTKIVTGAPVFLAHGPLLLLSAVLVQTGIVLVGLGLLAELLTRIYMDGRRRRIYTIAQPSIRRADADPEWSASISSGRTGGAPTSLELVERRLDN